MEAEPQHRSHARDLMASIVRFVLRRRVAVAAGIVISLVFAGFSALSIRARFQFSDFYLFPGNPGVEEYLRDLNEFGDPGGYVVTMIEADDVFDPAVLRYVEQVTNALTPLPEFARIRSLTNTNSVRSKGDEVVAGALMPKLPETAEQIRELKEYALGSRLISRRLLSTDAKATAVLAQLRVPGTLATVEQHEQALQAVEHALDKLEVPQRTKVRVTGASRVEAETTRALIQDQLVLMPTVILLLAVLLYLTFGTWHAVALAMGAVFTATVWTAGVFALFHRPVDIISSVIPVVILVYGVVDPIFVLTRVLQKIELGRSKRAAIVEAFSELALPMLLTSATTALGFAGFLASTMPTIRTTGTTIALGVMLSWVTTNTVLPVLLAFSPAPRRRPGAARLASIVDSAARSTWAMLKNCGALAILTTLALVGLSASYASRQTISNTYVGSLPNGEARDDVRRFEEKLSGVMRFAVYLEGAPGAFKDPKVLKALDQLEGVVRSHPHTTLAISLSDIVAETHQAFMGGAPEERAVPTSTNLIGQYLALAEPADRAELVSDDYARSHLAILARDKGSVPMKQFAENLQQAVAAAGLAELGIQATVTGNGAIGYVALDSLVVELLYGFVTAFLLVVVLQWLMFRSLRVALLSIVPNLVPVIACFSSARLLDIDLRVDTALVLCICIGGLFNTTIHYFARIRAAIKVGARDRHEIVLLALRTITPPSFYTTIILSVGFAVFMLSSFSGLQAMGAMSMVTLLTGFVSDLIITTLFANVLYAWPPPSAQAATATELTPAL